MARPKPEDAPVTIAVMRAVYDSPMPLVVDLAVPLQLLVLIGGGEFSFGETREIDDFLLRNLDKQSVAFLPTASGSAEYARHFGAYLGIDTVNVPIYRGRDNRRQKNLNAITSAGMVYLGGGVTNALLSTLRESLAELALRDAAANGVVVAAIGAAAACFGTHARDMREAGQALPALGWLADTVVEPAFDRDNDTMLRRLMSIDGVRLGIGIPAKTAVAVRGDGSTEIIGSGQVAVFRKS
jgi:cyanophycinase-like exopeptidase